jgi:hypothetical protein
MVAFVDSKSKILHDIDLHQKDGGTFRRVQARRRRRNCLRRPPIKSKIILAYRKHNKLEKSGFDY